MEGGKHINFGVVLWPNVALEFGAAVFGGGEEYAFQRSDTGTDANQIIVGGLRCVNEPVNVVGARSNNQQVVRKRPRFGLHRHHQTHPGPEEKGHKEHGEGATLGDTTWAVVGSAFEEIAVGVENGHRHAGDHGEVI